MTRLLCVLLAAAVLSACSLFEKPVVEPPVPPSIAYAPSVVEEFGERVREKIEDKLDAVKERVEEKVEDVKEKADELVEHIREFTLEQRLDRWALIHLISTGEALDWRGSCVDLLKLVRWDSGKPARRGYAGYFNYPRRYFGSARDNVWLHARVLEWLREGK